MSSLIEVRPGNMSLSQLLTASTKPVGQENHGIALSPRDKTGFELALAGSTEIRIYPNQSPLNPDEIRNLFVAGLAGDSAALRLVLTPLSFLAGEKTIEEVQAARDLMRTTKSKTVPMSAFNTVDVVRILKELKAMPWIEPSHLLNTDLLGAYLPSHRVFFVGADTNDLVPTPTDLMDSLRVSPRWDGVLQLIRPTSADYLLLEPIFKP